MQLPPGGAGVNPIFLRSEYLISDVSWSSDGEAQTQDHAGRLGDETDQVEGGGRLVRRAVEKHFFHYLNFLFFT